jgi:hypothetical protein
MNVPKKFVDTNEFCVSCYVLIVLGWASLENLMKFSSIFIKDWVVHLWKISQIPWMNIILAHRVSPHGT